MRLPTMISLDYEAEKWSYQRIVLDGISNHIDAVGSLDRVTVSISPSRIVISDDGPGYDFNLLGLLYSTKAGDPGTIGQFGEGIKLIAAAALRSGLGFSVRSRDWIATATAEHVEVEVAPGQKKQIARLAWDVEQTHESITGSRTIIYSRENLPRELTSLFGRWLDFFLPDDRRSIEHAWKEETPRLFVKGVYVKDIPDYYFSYNLTSCQINRDRDTIDLYSAIRRFWQGTHDEMAIRHYLEVAHKFGNGICTTEFTMYLWLDHAQAWRACFHSMFGENAVLYTDERFAYMASGLGFTPVVLPSSVRNSLQGEANVRRDMDVLTESVRYGLRDLTGEEAEVVSCCMRLIRSVNADIADYPVYAMENGPEGLAGVALRQETAIAVRADYLKDVNSALPVLVEEITHLESGGADFTREFEDWLCRFAAAALLKSNIETSDHGQPCDGLRRLPACSV